MLKAVISQRLIPRADGLGRAAAVEVMISTPFIRDCIVDKEKTHLIPGAIAAGTSQYGMQTFDQSIFMLYESGIVSYEEALHWATNVDEFKLRVQGIAMTSDAAREEMERAGMTGAPAWTCSGSRSDGRDRPAAGGLRPAARRRHARHGRTSPLDAAPGDTERCRRPQGASRKPMNDPVRAAYAAGLAMLSRRELSEAQVRERLRRKDHPAEAIDAAVGRLKDARALDDRRVALAAARTEAQVRSRGRGYVLRRLQHLGIAAELAEEAVNEVFGALDEQALLDRAIARRLRGPVGPHPRRRPLPPAPPAAHPAGLRRLHDHRRAQGAGEGVRRH